MKHLKRYFWPAALLLVLSLAFAACAPSVQPPPVTGKWQYQLNSPSEIFATEQGNILEVREGSPDNPSKVVYVRLTISDKGKLKIERSGATCKSKDLTAVCKFVRSNFTATFIKDAQAPVTDGSAQTTTGTTGPLPLPSAVSNDVTTQGTGGGSALSSTGTIAASEFSTDIEYPSNTNMAGVSGKQYTFSENGEVLKITGDGVDISCAFNVPCPEVGNLVPKHVGTGEFGPTFKWAATP